RQDALGPLRGRQLARHPVASDGAEPDVQRLTPDLRPQPPPETREHGDPISDAEPAEPEPLLLHREVQLLGGQLAFELALEVVEQAVPAHPAHINPRHALGSINNSQPVYRYFPFERSCGSLASTPVAGVDSIVYKLEKATVRS